MKGSCTEEDLCRAPGEHPPCPPGTFSAAVVGAINMDLTGTPFSTLRPGDSNPGQIRLTPGGVGRNIAENLVRLGLDVTLLTAFGRDPFGAALRDHCRETGIDLSLALTLPGCGTSAYLCVTEPDGDLHTAVSDMSIYDRLLPDQFAFALPHLKGWDLVVLDANLPAETLAWLAGELTAPLAADPVSVAKAPRLKAVLPRLTLLKPNVPEAEVLTGMTIRTESDLHQAADRLLAAGVKQVFLSLGGDGVLACDAESHLRLPCFPGPIRNTTGCGDAFLAAVCLAWLRRLDLKTAARWGLAAAALCAEDPGAVCASLSPDRLAAYLGNADQSPLCNP